MARHARDIAREELARSGHQVDVSVSYRIENTTGRHTTLSVFVGKQPGSRSKAGQLTIRNSEFVSFCEKLERAGFERGDDLA